MLAWGRGESRHDHHDDPRDRTPGGASSVAKPRCRGYAWSMPAKTELRNGSISVPDSRCDAAPGDVPFVELHHDYSVSYVRQGSFGYRCRGESFELVAGSVLVGHAGDEFMCTHDHVRGDECLSFGLAREVVDAIDDRAATWR